MVCASAITLVIYRHNADAVRTTTLHGWSTVVLADVVVVLFRVLVVLATVIALVPCGVVMVMIVALRMMEMGTADAAATEMMMMLQHRGGRGTRWWRRRRGSSVPRRSVQ